MAKKCMWMQNYWLGNAPPFPRTASNLFHAILGTTLSVNILEVLLEWPFWKLGKFRVRSPLSFCWLSPSTDTLSSYWCFACVLPCAFSRKLQLFGSHFCHRILHKYVHLLSVVVSGDTSIDLWNSCTKQHILLKHAEYCGCSSCIILGWG